jgi:hypothetical protein
MARKPDRPGTYRVLDRNGRYVVSGVRPDGQRVKMRAENRIEAVKLGETLFGGSSPVSTPIGPIPSAPQSATATDDWGVPIRVSPEVAASVAASFNLNGPGGSGVGTGPTPSIDPAVTKDETEKKIRRAKQAKSLMELAGVGYAAGVCIVSTKAVSKVSSTPSKPNPKQVNDLADCTKETFIEWFGDREIKPWQMMFLLTLGIPIAMYLQSPKDKKQQAEPKLKSVP